MSSVALRMGRQEVGGGHPSLDLNFVAGAWPAGLSFSRASGATVNCWARYDQRAPSGGFFGGLADWFPGGSAALSFAGNTVTATHTGASYAGASSSALILEAGKVYRITVNITANSAGRTVQIAHQGVAGLASINSTGLLQATYRPATTGRLAIEFTTDAVIGNSFTASTLMLEELTLWQPGMDWLGPELVTVNSAVMTGANSAYTAITGAPAKAGRTYKVQYAINQPVGDSQASVGTVALSVEGSGATGVKRFTIVAAADNPPTFYSNFSAGTITDFSVREQCFTLQTVLVPANIPRIAYDPVTGACPGAMVEPQRTNLLNQSETWVGPSASANGVTWTVTAQIVGGVRAYDFSYAGTPTTTDSVPFGVVGASGLMPALPGVKYCHSAKIKRLAGNHGDIYLPLVWDDSAPAYLGQTNAPTIDGVSQTQYEGRNPLTSPLGTATVRLGFGLVNLTAGSPISGVLRVSELQIEAGSEKSSYIPTAGAAATRAADLLYTDAAGSIPADSAGTLVFEGEIAAGVGNSNFDRLVEFGVPFDQSNVITIARFGTAASVYGEIKKAGTNLISTAGSAVPVGINTPFKVAITWGPTGSAVCVNGGAVLTGSAGAPALPRLFLGQNAAGTGLMLGKHRRGRFYRRAMTPAELQAVTK